MSDIRIKQQTVNAFARLSTSGVLRSALRPVLLLTGAGLFWLVSLPNIDPGKMNDLGLVSVLPVSFFVSLALIAISFIASLHQEKPNEFILLAHILVLILIIHGTPEIVYGTVRYSWAWKHVGIVDYIQRHGSVNPSIYNLNAYHNWPGFFAWVAFYNEIAGVKSSLSYAGWGPVFFNLLNLGALLMIFKTLTNDRRLVWLGIWFFFLFSWIGQDYFSPQALAYFLYLIAMAIILRFFRISDLSSRWNAHSLLPRRRITRLYHAIIDRSILNKIQPVETTARQRVLLMAILVLLFAVITSSHQLTPVMVISGLAVLVLFQVTNQRYLPVLMLTITTAWVIFMAVGFLNGNMYWIVRSIGSLLDNVNDNLINLNHASPGQQIIAIIDRALSVSVWILGFMGLYRRYRSGFWDLPALLLAFSPIPILAFNAYGGEMLFRVYLFALPFITFFAAALFYPKLEAGTSFTTPVFVTLVSFLLIPGFLYSYYGKERMYYFSPNEVAAAQFVYRIAPQGALIVDSTWDWPRQAENYEFYNYRSLVRLTTEERAEVLLDPVTALSEIMNEPISEAVYINSPGTEGQTGGESSTPVYPAAYLIFTRSQRAEAEMTGVLPPNWFTTITEALSHASNFQVIYENEDAVVYEYLHPLGGS